MKKVFFALGLLTCLLSGCGTRKQPAVSVVTKITVSTADRPGTPIRVYSDSRKMKYVLDYLRLLDRRTAGNGEAEAGNGITYLITLHRSDGSTTLYRQKAWRYLHSRGDGWQKIPPRQAQRLPLLLAAIPGDDESGS